MAIEYRLVVKKWGQKHVTPKRNLVHAEKGLDDALNDFLTRQQSYVGTDVEVWIEEREVGEWRSVYLEEVES